MGYFRGKPELNIHVLEEAQKSWLPTGSDHEQGVSEGWHTCMLCMLCMLGVASARYSLSCKLEWSTPTETRVPRDGLKEAYSPAGE